MNKNQLEIVIPTLNRSEVLLDSIGALISLDSKIQIHVIDQTQDHPKSVESKLKQLHSDGQINLVHLNEPSVVKAMNIGLKVSTANKVLFLDDDIIPSKTLLEQHLKFIGTQNYQLVAGRVIQPWDAPEGTSGDSSTRNDFNYPGISGADFFIGANFLIDRDFALKVGGFDENFVGTSHDYEKEFSDRVRNSGGEIAYNGLAAVQHLKAPAGGIRVHGHFLKTMKPHHAVGAYYYILTSKLVTRKLLKIGARIKQRVFTKTHLKSPWWIPLTLCGDLAGLVWAIYLRAKGPKLIKSK